MTLDTAKNLAFRLRVWIFAVLYLLGFLAPWRQPFLHRSVLQSLLHVGSGTLWLAASTLLYRTGWIGLEASTAVVTVAALCCCSAGAALRVWGTASLGGPGMRDSALRGDSMTAAGPFRYLRNPFALGSLLLAAGVAILMPPTGALVFFAATCLFECLLISRREALLSSRLGDTYGQYIRRVPCLLPRAAAGIPPPPSPERRRPHWLKAVLAEIFPVGFALCFAVFAWRYDALILIKCLIVCCGLSLIVRALWPISSTVATVST